MKIQCCVCLRIREDEGWKTLRESRVLDHNASHGYCPKCAEKAFAELRAQQRAEHPRQTPAVVNF